MFPITLEFRGDVFATCWPPCYGFLRGAEWNDWDQRFHDGFAIRNSRRERLYNTSTITEEKPFGNKMTMTAQEDGTQAIPGDLFNLEELRVIWNSGARTPIEARVFPSDPEPVAWRFPDDADTTVYSIEELERFADSPLDIFNKKWDMNLTLQQVLTDLEQNIDAGRDSVLRFRDNGYGTIMGVSTEDVPCDRVMFYLMVGRELDGYNKSAKMMTFLRLHYVMKVPIMIAFMASRVFRFAGSKTTNVHYCGENNDGCILPVQNFWVGCGKRFKEPTAIAWQQHSYTTGCGHDRDDDLSSYYMEPVIEGFDELISEEFNESIFNAVFGGTLGQGDALIDRPGGEKVENLVARFFREVSTPDAYRNRGSNTYCSYWTSDRALYDETSSYYSVKNPKWMETLISLLMEE